MPTVSQYHARRRASATQPAPVASGPRPAPVVLMVSGGADSTALLVMACTAPLDIADGAGAARIARERIHVLHVNHHLRGEASDGDEAYVRALCERYGVPLLVEHAHFQDLGGRNLEAAARDVRYRSARRYARALCEEAGCRARDARILTAHTASDRTETFFMNAIKGSGAAGLSSIPRRRGAIVRPLLDRTHDELCRYLREQGIGWREDETNQDTAYLRNFVRHRVVPLVRERNGRIEQAVCASCDILGDEDAFLQRLAATALRACTRQARGGMVVLDARKLAATELAVARRIIRLAVRGLDAEARLESHHVEAVLDRVAEGEGSVTLPLGIDARLEFGTLTLRTATARERLAAGWLAVPGSMATANERVLDASLERVETGADPVARAREAARESHDGTVLVDAAALGYAERDFERLGTSRDGIPAEARTARLWIDAPAPGDVLCPLGMQGRSKKLSDLLNEAHVPVADRPLVPVVRTAPGGAVVWVAGIRLDDRFRVTPTTRVLVKLSLRRATSAPREA